MKTDRYIYIGWLVALLIWWGGLLTACSDQSDIDGPQPVPADPTEDQSGEPLYVAAMTRDGGDAVEEVDPLKNENVQLFVYDGSETQSGSVLYKGKGDTSGDITWNPSNIKVKPGRDYQVFGFVPSTVAGSSSIDLTDVGNNIVKMTINDLSMISNKDVCVVIGADGKLAAGQTVKAGTFNYHAPEDTGEGYSVSLLADHLFAGVDFQFKVSAEYAALRTIRLKSVRLKSTNTKKVRAEVILEMNDNGSNPITNVTYSTPSATEQESILLWQSSDDKGDALSSVTPLAIQGYFASGYGSGLSVISTYDVWDKGEKECLRKGCTAENTLSAVLVREGVDLQRGRKMTVNLTVNPSYLYVLSDWDSPAFVIE